MKITLFSLLLLLYACGNEPKNAPTPETSALTKPNADSMAVVLAVRGFFDWYGQLAMSSDFADKFNFVDYKGEHPQLKPDLLEKFLSEFVKSGHCGQAFVQGEMAFYKKCAEEWKSVEVDDVPPCLDADRYYCAQEDVSEFYRKAEIGRSGDLSP